MKKSLFYIMFMMGLLVALPSHAIEYPSYKPSYRSTGYRTTNSRTYGQSQFSSAKVNPVSNYEAVVYTPFSSQVPTHSWNVSVSAMSNSSFTASSGPRRAGAGGWGNGDEEDDDEEDDNLSGSETGGTQNPDGPIGAMPWVMMAMMAAGYAYLRRKRTARPRG